MQLKTTLAALAVATAFVAQSAAAAIVAGPTIGGYQTFTDTNTGYHWLKMDSFFGASAAAMNVAASAQGFTWATRGEVQTLLDTIPLDGDAATWNGYASVMGDAPNRQLVWAAYASDSDANKVGWAYAYDYNSSWQLLDDVDFTSSVPNFGGPHADLNLWAYATGGAVPEPATWATMIVGFFGLGSTLRRRRAFVSA